MEALAALLSADLKIEKAVPLKRLGASITVKAIDGKTIGMLTEQSTYGSKLDEQKFGSRLIAEACVNNEFSDAALLKKYNASDAGDCVYKALLAGEVAKMSQTIMEISGFNDLDEQVAEAKN